MIQQAIVSWWTEESNPKLTRMFRAIPAIIMWTLWKRRNYIKHGGSVPFAGMVLQVQEVIKKWLKVFSHGLN